MIEQFSVKEFENVLPDGLWVLLGLKQGEYTYRIAGPDNRTAIEVRSSIRENGHSAPAGEDSIRVWLVESVTGSPLGSKVSRWITRQSGWETRLLETLRILWRWRMRAGDCPRCKKPKGIWKVKKDGENKGRPFAKCWNCGNGFVWLDEPPKRRVYFAPGTELFYDETKTNTVKPSSVPPGALLKVRTRPLTESGVSG